ncbi:MAG: hypothetical protein JO201_00830 [Verrucomicrobia bacterium]|nr:hypothetical protein [Verrucomicrobiota bacterium]
MKRIFALVVALFLSIEILAAAAVRYDAKTWAALKTYEAAALSKNLDNHVHELVALKCNFRGKDIRHTKPNWYQSSVWQPIADKTGKFADVPVMVAKPDLKAFKSIPTDSSGEEITLYGRVEYDVAARYYFVRLVGRNAATDSAGNATVTW